MVIEERSCKQCRYFRIREDFVKKRNELKNVPYCKARLNHDGYSEVGYLRTTKACNKFHLNTEYDRSCIKASVGGGVVGAGITALGVMAASTEGSVLGVVTGACCIVAGALGTVFNYDDLKKHKRENDDKKEEKKKG